MARVVVNDVTNVDPLEPPRRNMLVPEDMLSQAPRPVPTNGFLQLASALKDVSPQMDQFLGTVQKGQTQADIESAKIQHVQTGLAYQEAINRGLISPNQSPYFIRAWKELDGQNKADTITASVQQAYATDPIRNSSDPTAIQQWLRDKMHDQTSGITDPSELLGAAPRLQAFQESIIKQQTAQASSNAVYGMMNAAGTQIGNLIDQTRAASTAVGGKVDPSALSGVLQGPTGLAKFAGLDPKDADNVLMEAVVAKAKLYDDKSLLSVLTQTRPDFRNPGQTIAGPGTTAAGAGVMARVSKEIDQQIAQKHAQAYMEQEHAITQATMQAEKSASAEIAKTGSLSPATIAAMTSNPNVKPMALTEALGVVEALRKYNDYSTPSSVAQSYTHLFAGDLGTNVDGSPRSAVNWANAEVTSGRVSGPESFIRAFMTEAQALDQAGDFKDDQFKALYGRIAGTDMSPIKLFNNAADRVSAANDFGSRVAEWVVQARKGGTFSPSALHDFENDLSEKIVKRGSNLSATPVEAPQGKAAAISPQDLITLTNPKASKASLKPIKDKYTTEALEAAGIQP